MAAMDFSSEKLKANSQRFYHSFTRQSLKDGVFIEFLQGFRQTRGNTKISQVFCICLCVVSFLMSRPESDSTMVSSQGVRETQEVGGDFFGGLVPDNLNTKFEFFLFFSQDFLYRNGVSNLTVKLLVVLKSRRHL
jgi:hypothetical protein